MIYSIGAAACMVAAFVGATTATATAATGAPAVAAVGTITPGTGSALATPAVNSGNDCSNVVLPQNFWRCTEPSASSTWVGSGCAEGEYNAGTYFNMYAAINTCSGRVWIHEYTYPYDVTHGWSYCISPDEWVKFTANAEPENIMVSANTAPC